jgi:hypothetical protein
LKKQQGGLPLKIKPFQVAATGFYFFTLLVFSAKIKSALAIAAP